MCIMTQDMYSIIKCIIKYLMYIKLLRATKAKKDLLS